MDISNATVKPNLSEISTPQTTQAKQIKEKAKEFEAVFIAESLKFANIGMPKDSEMGSTLVTDTFDSFMSRALADTIVEQGGFGLAKHIEQSIYQSLNPKKGA